jgi:hypothetical protein
LCHGGIPEEPRTDVVCSCWPGGHWARKRGDSEPKPSGDAVERDCKTAITNVEGVPGVKFSVAIMTKPGFLLS